MNVPAPAKPRHAPAPARDAIEAVTTKRTKSKKPLPYFCMNTVDKVQCFEKDGTYDCWHYHPVYDYRKQERIMRREKVASVPNIYTIILSSRVDAKDKTVNITSHVNDARCYVNKKAMECLIPIKDYHDVDEFPCE
jgi:hypothetical protein